MATARSMSTSFYPKTADSQSTTCSSDVYVKLTPDQNSTTQ